MKKKETEEKLNGFKNCFYSLYMCLMYLHVRVRPVTITTFTGRCTVQDIIATNNTMVIFTLFYATKKLGRSLYKNCNETHW